MKQRHVVFSHGQGSGPWGAKIKAMAEVARERGFTAHSIDYCPTEDDSTEGDSTQYQHARGIDVSEQRVEDEPRARVRRLLDFCLALDGPPVLVGSSLGGHVAAAASSAVRARGLFLLAPAFYMPGYERHTPQPARCPLVIVHGWHDDVVPVENSIRYGREHGAALHILDGDHRLHANISQINALFANFLQTLE